MRFPLDFLGIEEPERSEVAGLLAVEVDLGADEAGVLLHDGADAVLVGEFGAVGLEADDDLGALGHAVGLADTIKEVVKSLTKGNAHKNSSRDKC